MYGRVGGTGTASTFDLAREFTNKAQGRWWEKKSDEPSSPWQQLVDKSGVEYYYNVETKETTWDKPVELMTADEMDQKGDWYWIPHDIECFIPARITASNASTITAIDQDGHTHTVKAKKSELEPVKRSSLQRVVPDLVLLDSMSAPLILHNLKERFAKQEIYTNVGTILIAINPYKALPLYGDDILRSYAKRRLGEEKPPHSFNIAHDSFVGLRDFNQNQSIIISGESGAGKTETTKHCLSYLTYMAGSGSNIATQILKTNPILEAFGNAKTLRNDNSSRFGKYMQIYFQGRHCSMSGCVIKNYLLEKIRVVQPQKDERNYHIFYMLMKGADANLRSKLKFREIEKYKYLKSCIDVPTIDDVAEFKEVLDAFKDLNFSQNEQDDIFSIVIAVATLGNIQFKENSNSYAGVTNNSDDSPLAIVAELLHIKRDVLEKALITKELKIRNQETTVMMLNTDQAESQRDALAKFIYSYLFDWLVVKLNKSIGQVADKSKFIGCLDIFGFEIFTENSLEQLCINYTNEMLQQHFNYQTFKLEEAVYKSENIQFKHIEFIDNQPMIDLISKRPQGLIPLLDEELVVPRGSDMGFLGKMNDHHMKNPVYKKDMRNPKSFMIKHYAGLVSYNVDGFLEKNRDTLTEDLVDVLKTSSLPLVNVLFPQDKEVSAKEKKASLGHQFSRQLEDLMATLRLTEPHYIRCIKPNADKTPTTFVPSMCNEQLTYSGVFEAVAIRKAGYPFRLKHDAFVTRYKVLYDDERVPGSGVKQQCESISEFMKLDRENVQMGSTMVLYRADEHKKLELHRNIKVKLTETLEDLNRLVKTNPSSFSDEDKEHFYIELAGAVRSADEFRLQTPLAQQARAMLDKYVEERMDPNTKAQLHRAIANKDQHELMAVLRVCEQNGYQTSLVRECQELLERIMDAEAALAMSISEANEEYLEKAVAMCDEFGYKSPAYERAMELKVNIGKAKEMIRRSLASLNHEHLLKTIEFCQSFNYTSTQVEQCHVKYKQVMRVRELLEAARAAVDIGMLKNATDAADELGYDDDLVYESRLLHGRLTRIEQEVEKGNLYKIDKQIRSVLKAANEVGYKSKSIRKLKSLADGNPQEYFQQQYQAAVKTGDHERAIAISLDLKKSKISADSDRYRLNKCSLLKEPLTWGKEKWWGSSQYRADTMLCFTDAYIHSPLTRVFDAMFAPRAKVLNPKVLLMYENTQKVMGQRKSHRHQQRLEEILMEPLEYPEIRDEAYISLMKFLTSNIDSAAVAKGWEIFTLVLMTYPPTVDLEDYVMAFLLLPANSHFSDKYNLPYLLVRISYLGAIVKPFWGARSLLHDVPRVIDYVLPKISDHHNITQTNGGTVGWEDMKIRFNDDDYQDKARDSYTKGKRAYKMYETALANSKKGWELQKGERAKAETMRNQGALYSQYPPLECLNIDQCIPQHISGPSGNKKDTDFEPSKSVASKKKKGGKKPKPTVESDDEVSTTSVKKKKRVLKKKVIAA